LAGKPFINIWAVAGHHADEDAVTIRVCDSRTTAIELANRVAPAYRLTEVRKYVVKETRQLFMDALMRGPGALDDERYQVYIHIPNDRLHSIDVSL
jgi:hypothetical protein